MFGSSASASDMLRANCSTTVLVADLPRAAVGAPEDHLRAARARPASRSSGASGVPAQLALPTSPVKKGKPWLPEHSSVKVTSRRGARGARPG